MLSVWGPKTDTSRSRDLPSGVCFRCWEGNHKQFECPRRNYIPDNNYCFNCGRYPRKVATCESCRDAHAHFLRKKALASRYMERSRALQETSTQRAHHHRDSEHLSKGQRTTRWLEDRRARSRSPHSSSRSPRRSTRDAEYYPREPPSFRTSRGVEIAPWTVSSGAYWNVINWKYQDSLFIFGDHYDQSMYLERYNEQALLYESPDPRPGSLGRTRKKGKSLAWTKWWIFCGLP